MGSADEMEMRQELARELRDRGAGSGVVQAADFQDSLDALGLRFGDSAVDRIMLSCSIDAEGNVDVGAFLAEAEAEREEGTGAGAASPRAGGAHAVEDSMHQADRVRVLNRHLHGLYRAFDGGEIGLDALRRGLADLGLRETPDTAKLLRERDFAFRELVTALSRDAAPTVARHAAGEVPPHARDREGDIITHRRAKAPNSDRARGSDVISWRYPHAPVAAGAAAAEVSVASSRRAAFNAGAGVARAIAEDPSPAAGGAGAPGDAGLVREQIFSSIRLLDQGSITTAQFRRRLDALGVHPTNEIERLIQVQDTDGSACFRDFVRAFDHYLRDYMPQEAQPRRASPRVPAPYHTEEDDHIHGKRRFESAPRSADEESQRGGTATAAEAAGPQQRPPTAVLTHGDIIGWTHAETTLERVEHSHDHAKHRSLQRKVEMARESGNILTWEEGARAAPDNFRNRPGSSHRSYELAQGNGDIIGWSSARREVVDLDEAAARKRQAGSRLDLGGGRAPFGTDSDLGPGQSREAFRHKVPAKTKAHYPQPRTGEWFRPPARERPPTVHVGAPFGTDEDLPSPQRARS